jgi:hypothetical protein
LQETEEFQKHQRIEFDVHSYCTKITALFGGCCLIYISWETAPLARSYVMFGRKCKQRFQHTTCWQSVQQNCVFTIVGVSCKRLRPWKPLSLSLVIIKKNSRAINLCWVEFQPTGQRFRDHGWRLGWRQGESGRWTWRGTMTRLQ